MKATSTAILILSTLLLVSTVAKADLKSCSEPAQICSAEEGGTVSIESCSVTCDEGVTAMCIEGSVLQTFGRPSCVIQSENDCYCDDDERKVEALGDHE